MKKIIKSIFVFGMLANLFAGCKKDEYKDYYEGGTVPMLTATTSSINLNYADTLQTAIAFSWTNPNYQFTTGISSQNVNYTLEIDTTGANFTNSKRKQISISQDLALSITVRDFNDYLNNQLLLTDSVPHKLEARVIASLLNGSVPLISNTVKFTATPYAIPPKVPIPFQGTLYITGDATPGGWQTGGAAGTSPDPSKGVPVPSQQFRQVSLTDYQLTLPLTAGKQYLLLPVNGNWNFKYALKDNTMAGISDSGDFGYNSTNPAFGANFISPAVSGNYLIDVNFQTGKFTVTKQ